MLKKTTSDEKKAKYLLLLLSNHQTLSKIHTIHESFKSWSTNYAIVVRYGHNTLSTPDNEFKGRDAVWQNPSH